MRKRLHTGLYIYAIIISCILLSCSPSSEERAKEMAINVSHDDLSVPADSENEMEASFKTDSLTEEQLNLFQKRAQQKLDDFISYVEIVSNKSYDPQLRLIASEQIEDLFADSSNLITVSINKNNPRSVKAFIDDIYQGEYDSLKIKTDSIVVIQPKKSDKAISYIGHVTAKVTIQGHKNGSVVFNSNNIYDAQTIIRKTPKQFGKETNMIWSVVLGEIK